MGWQASFRANWAVGDVCKVFAYLLGSELASFGTELLFAALTYPGLSLNQIGTPPFTPHMPSSYALTAMARTYK